MNAMDAEYETDLRIPRSHPALAGHFPGRPIVPAVVLLDCVLLEAERWLGRQLSIELLAQAKFTAPLLPEQDARMKLSLHDAQLRFGLTRAGRNIAQGTLRIADRKGA